MRAYLDQAPAEPATALWRSIELGHLVASNELPRTGRGLDVGCGDGLVTRLIGDELDARWLLTGLDPDDDELRRAAERGVYVDLQCSDGASVGAADQSFDFVFSNSVLEHVEELEPLLREVGRVLRLGGRFVFTVPSEGFHENLGGPGILGRLATGASDRSSYHCALDRRLAHVRYLGIDDWRQALADAGLRLIHESDYLTPKETRRWAAASNVTAGLLVRLLGRRRSPIELQRSLGIRGTRPPRWIRVVGRVVGRLAAVGLDGDDRESHGGSCLLLVAERA